MRPYYEHAGITLYHGDCRDILPQLGRFDLLMTDPPYGIKAARSSFGGRTGDGSVPEASVRYRRHIAPTPHVHSLWDDKHASMEDINAALARCKHAVVWGGNYFALPPSRCWMVWDKLRGDADFADGEMAWTNLNRTLRIFRYRWNGICREDKEPRLHPTQKPYKVIKWAMSQVGRCESVLDPYCGSGTTLVVAKDMGMTAVGIEREERYCEVVAERLRQEVLSLVG